ncbi:hypothetical protein BH11PSE5_BH11PSE5_08450 [soil metagenome]
MPRNIAEFRIIGQVGGVDEKEKVTFVNVASNYNRQLTVNGRKRFIGTG